MKNQDSHRLMGDYWKSSNRTVKSEQKLKIWWDCQHSTEALTVIAGRSTRTVTRKQLDMPLTSRAGSLAVYERYTHRLND